VERTSFANRKSHEAHNKMCAKPETSVEINGRYSNQSNVKFK